jgi:Arc/MetJ-type ribon-helix-helix transcriptional regulator
MSNEKSDASENVRQHVRKMLVQLRALKEQQRDEPGPDIAVEIDRKENPSSSVSGGEGPA